MRKSWVGLITLALAMVGCGADSETKSAPKSASAVAPAPVKPAQAAMKPQVAAEPSRLNVVLITLDTTRADALGAYGQSLPTSPHMDRLAKEGVVFERAVTSSPETLPSHATLFTGLHPFTHGVRSNGGYVLSEDNTTLAEVLSKAGYKTGAEVAAVVMNESTQIHQGFDHYKGATSANVELKKVNLAGPSAREIELQIRTGADITRNGISFIRKNRSKPFFLWLHYFDPHVPYAPDAEFNTKIPSSQYHAEVAYADARIGAVIREIETLKLRDHTLVILTSDHGESLGEHNEQTHSYYVYQSTMHVPLIFWGPPQLAQGTRVASTVRAIDIAPTVYDLTNVEGPGRMQGATLRPLLEGKNEERERVAYGESIELSKVFDVSPLRILVAGRWKYIHKIGPELYDLDADPHEHTNLASREPEMVVRLRARLAELIEGAEPSPQNAAASVDDETRARLEALGYVAGPASAALRASIDSLALSGVDANAKADEVRQMGVVSGHMKRKEFDEALGVLESLRASNPTSAHIHSLISKMLIDVKRPQEAIGVLRTVMDLDPANIEDRQNLAILLLEVGDRNGAIEVLLEVFDLEQCEESYFGALNDWLLAEERYADRVATLGRAANMCPEIVSNLNNYAWALATSPEAAVRNGALAVEVALNASKKRGTPDAAYLDTLAAAHAEAGNFEEAVRVETKAVKLLESARAPTQVVAAFQNSLNEFKAGRALRDPAESTTNEAQ